MLSPTSHLRIPDAPGEASEAMVEAWAESMRTAVSLWDDGRLNLGTIDVLDLLRRSKATPASFLHMAELREVGEPFFWNIEWEPPHNDPLAVLVPALRDVDIKAAIINLPPDKALVLVLAGDMLVVADSHMQHNTGQSVMITAR